ncbi:hypothetical protein B0H13DRAFT_2309839 [Mycena leptocephala]|nr:hypothetical protein B0H13DRAFT_2309839 [Mycena leptocephala]
MPDCSLLPVPPHFMQHHGVLEEYFGQTCVGDAGNGRGMQREHQGMGQCPWWAFNRSPATRRNRPPLHALSRCGRDERHPSHVTRSPTNPLSEFEISLADYGPIDEELKPALPCEWRWSVAARLLAD